MKKILLTILIVFLFSSCATYNTVHPSRTAVTTISIPNLNGYLTLFCDFHTHTVFSDGFVWPTVRVEEAYYDGLSAISITDHIERRIFPKYKSSSHNRAYEEALTSPMANEVIIIKGSEISRDMPPGHLNAIFLTDCNQLDRVDYMDVLRAAKKQDAFIFWNHPGWKKQQFKKTTKWWPEHTQLMEEGLLHGIEVANGSAYYPEAHLWCLEKNLTMIGSTDVHKQLPAFPPFKHRTMTLVFARERSASSIYEALMDRRTAVYSNNLIIGDEKYLKELFEKSINFLIKQNEKTVDITFDNNTDLTFKIKFDEHDTFLIMPHALHSINIENNDDFTDRELNFIVENFLVGPNIKMNYKLKL